MLIEYRGILTKVQYNKMVKKHMIPSPQILFLLSILVVVFLVFSIYEFAKYGFQNAFQFPILVVFFYFVARLFLIRNVFLEYNLKPELRSLISGSITTEEVTISTINATTKYKWSVYKRAIKMDDIVMLYPDQKSFNCFPKSFFQKNEDWETFLRLIDENLPGKVIKG
jgi:hypothetical protein